MSNYIYGPVASRRLGRSLGVDPIPLKTCNWNCVYCQLGRTSPLVDERKEWIPTATILAELDAVLAHHGPGEIDFISFVGSGEPTLHSGLGEMIGHVKQRTAIPVAVITNGALLFDAAVRRDLALADVIMPTLCAGEERLYQQIHRPHPDATFARLLSGIGALRAEWHGQLWLEVMLMAGLNDTPDALAKLAAAMTPLRPDQIHLVLPERPPAEEWVDLADEAGIQNAIQLLSPVAPVLFNPTPAPATKAFDDPVEAIVAVVGRHPMTGAQLEEWLDRWPPAHIRAVLDELAAEAKITAVETHGQVFWTAPTAHYHTAS